MRRKHLLTAIVFDMTIGDPPNRWHPVAWMGTTIYWLRRHAPQRGKFIFGGLIAWGGAVVVWISTVFVICVIERLPQPLSALLQAWLLKTTFSLQGLNNAAYEVETALQNADIVEARRLLSWHLVSRDTSALNPSQVAAATIESVAENTSDGVIAPLFWYGIGGLPAAMTYRYLQTCDSILGYRDTEREWLGKIPARTDDVLNLIPARITGMLLVLVRPRAWHIWRHDAHLTASPNAGHPMSAMAGALDIELEKVDHYHLNANAPAPQTDDIQRSRHLMLVVVGMFVGLLLLVMRHDDD
ncbi:MAG: adenosylcobinamide-phosphate synthase CbiB [Chloroflexota bacterium]